eukprot:15759902-Heterocapsa_arctica.AAC.1
MAKGRGRTRFAAFIYPHHGGTGNHYPSGAVQLKQTGHTGHTASAGMGLPGPRTPRHASIQRYIR